MWDISTTSFDINQELADYKQLYATLIFGIDDVDGFLEKADLDKRRCIKLLPVLTEYKEMLENAVGDGKHKAEIPDSLLSFRQQHLQELEKLKDCAECKCLKCARDCNMSGCNRCDPGCKCKIVSCDNKKAAIYTFDNKTVDLKNNDTGGFENLKALAVIEDLEYKQLYIVLERGSEKVIMYYYPSIKEDSYGEISDLEDMDFAVKAFENRHLS